MCYMRLPCSNAGCLLLQLWVTGRSLGAALATLAAADFALGGLLYCAICLLLLCSSG
jgi:hypothetical protein